MSFLLNAQTIEKAKRKLFCQNGRNEPIYNLHIYAETLTRQTYIIMYMIQMADASVYNPSYYNTIQYILIHTKNIL